MKKMRLSNPELVSENSPKKDKDEDPDKRRPDPDDPNQQKGPPIKEMPLKDRPDRKESPDR